MRDFIFCTHSVAGALPIGIVITSYEQMERLTEAFTLLKSENRNETFFSTGRFFAINQKTLVN